MLKRDTNNAGYIQENEIKIEKDALKEEPDDYAHVKEELYANHEIKEDMVIGPEMVQPAVLPTQCLRIRPEMIQLTVLPTQFLHVGPQMVQPAVLPTQFLRVGPEMVQPAMLPTQYLRIGPEMIQPTVLPTQFLGPLEQNFVDKDRNLTMDVNKSKMEEYLAANRDSHYDNDLCTSSEESDGYEDDATTSSQEKLASIWSPNPFPDRPIFPFLLNNPGKLTIPVHLYNRTPLTYFNLILTNEILDVIVKETNKNAVAFIRPLLTTSNYQWEPITREELLVFFGLLIHMGTVKMPDIEDYWSSMDSHDGLLYFECFSKVMSKNRFKSILNYLSFCAVKLPTCKRRHKIINIVEHFNNRMNKVYIPHKELCVEEPIVINDKHSKIKLYMLLESSGLVLKIHPEYVVEDNNISEDNRSHNTQNIVKKLVQNLKYLGYSLYTSKIYSSIPLAEGLLKDKIYCTGILRPNTTEIPREVTKAQLVQGGMLQRFSPQGVCVSKWKNNRHILMLSTEWSGDIREYQTPGSHIRKPENVHKYTQYMNMDKILANNCESWSLKWDKILTIYIIEMIVTNSWRFFSTENTNVNQKEYRLQLTKQLLSHNYPNRPTFSQIPQARNIGHFPRSTSPKPMNLSRRKLLRCQQCELSKIIKKTKYYCSGCPPITGLCVECFGPYHTATLQLQF